MGFDKEVDSLTENARINMKNKALGFGADGVNSFAHTNQGNDSSNDPNYVRNNAQDARRRIAPTAMGQSANDVRFFSSSSEPVASSNDPKHIQKMFEDAKRGNVG